MANRPQFGFVVPCFNEEDNVANTVDSIRAALKPGQSYEIILVDDCSRDRTLERMNELAAADKHIRVLHNPVNLNFGGAYKRGLAEATAEYVMMLPGDDGFPPESIAEILSHAGEADAIIPIITNPMERTRTRILLSKGFTALMNWLFWLKVGYYNGAVLQRTDLLRGIQIKTNSFAYQAEALVKLFARGASYTHCGVRIKERAAGRSSATSLRNQVAVAKTFLHLVRTVGVFRCRKPG